jgi:hypothetical protein
MELIRLRNRWAILASESNQSRPLGVNDMKHRSATFYAVCIAVVVMLLFIYFWEGLWARWVWLWT